MAKIKLLAVFLGLIILFTSTVFSATVTGSVYDEDINPAVGAAVKLEKDGFLHSQAIIDETGTYQFSNLSAGIYRLVASIKKDNLTLQTAARLNLSEEDTVNVDLLLLPELGVEIPNIITIEEEKGFSTVVEETSTEDVPRLDMVLIGFGFVLVVIVGVVIFTIWKRKTEELTKEIKEIKTKKEEPLPLGKFLTDEERIYQLIRRRGEIPQKHIVTETGFSKAKITFILKKLEKLGKITRTEAGREKIIKAVD